MSERERVSLEEEVSMIQPDVLYITAPEYQHPEDDDYNPCWEENEWVDAAYYEGNDYADDGPTDQDLS